MAEVGQELVGWVKVVGTARTISCVLGSVSKVPLLAAAILAGGLLRTLTLKKERKRTPAPWLLTMVKAHPANSVSAQLARHGGSGP